MHTGATLLVTAGLARTALAQYAVVDNFTGANFFSGFTFFTGADPTNGFVNYLDSSDAASAGLTSINAQGQVYMGVDSTTTLSSTGTGRNSVRIASNNVYTHYLSIIDLAHMPGGVCGTWPALYVPHRVSDISMLTTTQLVLRPRRRQLAHPGRD